MVKAMILAAGRGNRLRPLTDKIPKPLVPLCAKPLIEYHIEKLAQCGIKEIVINHAWLGEQLEQQLGDGSRWSVKIHYSAEPEGGLETAGGIIKALNKLGDHPFIVINSDVFCDFDFQPLIDKAQQLAQQSELLGHLYLVPSPQHNQSGDFGLLRTDKEVDLVTESGPYTFAGISVLAPKLFEKMAVDFIPLAPILRQAMSQKKLTGHLQPGLWSDIGTIERLNATQQLVCPQQD